MSAKEFWTSTFAEWWPLYNAVFGHVEKPLSKDEFETLEDNWANG